MPIPKKDINTNVIQITPNETVEEVLMWLPADRTARAFCYVVLAVEGHADVESGLGFLGDVTQAVVALAMCAAVLAFFFGLVEPVKRQKIILSTAQRFAAAAGGVRATARQA